ncbi:hypothetical protein T11_2844 [Trichinella zimbabwensis]|uniref:Uncharacterized protein n=1 Tax=Trichinella zimbabwensis TaxID=268475 RepID=A0A0V1GID8_9BILA|nr:hypothetical protein T11_2844 [Trichinella zimbabwensis]
MRKTTFQKIFAQIALKFTLKSPCEHQNRAQFALKSAKNDFSENFRSNRPVSIKIVLNSP